jgi:hypothetical protein
MCVVSSFILPGEKVVGHVHRFLRPGQNGQNRTKSMSSKYVQHAATPRFNQRQKSLSTKHTSDKLSIILLFLLSIDKESREERSR